MRTNRAVTLLELLVVISIVALLASMLLVTVAKARSSSRNFACKNNLKTIAFDFIQFAEDSSHTSRGDSEPLGRGGFFINDFQERVYGISEFFKPGMSRTYDPREQPMMCPEGPQVLNRLPGLPCESYAVTPVENVSTALNMRLYKASVDVGGRSVLQDVKLSSQILTRPGVPLAFDVDGRVAADRRLLPYYSAPPVASRGVYAAGLFWFPALRHANRLNAAFVGGYVLSAREPDRPGGWDWQYQPPPY